MEHTGDKKNLLDTVDNLPLLCFEGARFVLEVHVCFHSFLMILLVVIFSILIDKHTIVTQQLVLISETLSYLW